MVRALDQVGNKLPFLFDPVEIDIAGAATLVGPRLVPLRGGATGFWLESTGTPGPITVKVTSPRFGTTTISLSAT
jgi:beta-galactosidase